MNVLLVEDEGMLLGLLRRSLEKAGHSVIAVGTAEEALDAFSKAQEELNYLVTDQSLPGMSGVELAGELLTRDVRLLAVLCSGLPVDLEGLPAEVRLRAATIQKPFGMEALLALLRPPSP